MRVLYRRAAAAVALLLIGSGFFLNAYAGSQESLGSDASQLGSLRSLRLARGPHSENDLGAARAERDGSGMGVQGNRGGATSVLGIQRDQLVPLALSLLILLGATGLVWKIRART